MVAALLLPLFLLLQTSPAEVRVVDADTFDVGPVRYRLADVDAPELNGRCLAERRLAALAAAEARRLFNGAGAVAFEPTGVVQPARGRYRERVVARVTLDGRDLGQALIASGYAQAWAGREPWC